jgi:hypothetical protein
VILTLHSRACKRDVISPPYREETNVSDRRQFLSILAGASAASACSGQTPAPAAEGEDALEGALRDLNQAAGLGIAEDDFDRARSYAAGAYREAARSLRTIEVPEGFDLPVAFSAKRPGTGSE